MFRIRHLCIDTHHEHVLFIHEAAIEAGDLGFRPLDRVRVVAAEQPRTEGMASPIGGSEQRSREVTGILNLCRNSLVTPDEIGLSDEAFADLGLPEGTLVHATIAPAPRSIDLVRGKLAGRRLDEAAFQSILGDVIQHRYSKVELTMFVLACALRSLDRDELVAFTRSMISTGRVLDFGTPPIVDKHCIGGVPGNRTTMVVVPILASLGLTVPKTSSRAITSPAGTADTMGMLAEVALTPARLLEVVRGAGACVAWGGALDLAPADDILITVERPMEIDAEAQMVASILAKKKTVGATHVLIDIPVGRSAKVRTRPDAERLATIFRDIAQAIDLQVDTVITDARGPIGYGIGPRLEALDVLAVLDGAPEAPLDLREKSLFLAGRLLELTGRASPAQGYRAAEEALASGAARRAFDRIVDCQGRRSLPDAPAHRSTVLAAADGRIKEIDCWEIARVAKRAGAPANPAAGVRLLRSVGDVIRQGEPIFEIYAQSAAQLGFARAYADEHPELLELGF